MKIDFKKYLKEAQILFLLIVIAFTVKSTLIEIYVVPTGSMENEILVGDLLIGNKFTYGMRTPNWIGIPYTRIGFDIPYTRLPGEILRLLKMVMWLCLNTQEILSKNMLKDVLGFQMIQFQY